MAARVLRQWPLLVVLLGIVVAMIFVAIDRFRVGSVLLAASVVAAWILRAALTDTQAGLLVVRKRPTDLAVLGVLAIGLVVLSLWVPPPS
ncbi:MAG: DUF3017 domain-containing protein [Candidatus Nanopelagicales bacterium]